MTYFNWLRRRWVAASAAKKYAAVAGLAILGMAILGSLVLLGTELTRQQVGFGSLAIVVGVVAAIVAIALYEGHRHPRPPSSRRYPPGDSRISHAGWKEGRDRPFVLPSDRL